MDDRPPDRSAAANPRQASHRFPRWIWGVYLLLFGVSVPWYLPTTTSVRVWFGLQHWVVISLLATLGIAVFTALVVYRYWPDEEDQEP